MSFVVADRVQETCVSPGTGTVNLLGAVTGYKSFSSSIGANNTCYYVIADQYGTNWEVGIGTIGSGGITLARTTVLASSNGGSLVAFTSGTQNVWVDYPATKVVTQDLIYAPSSFQGTFTDGIVMDYVTGNGRFSVGTADGFTWYNGGVGSTSLMTLSNAGKLSTIADASINGLTVGKGANGVTYNTALGNGVLSSGSLSGNYNTGIGALSLQANTSGTQNQAFGYAALNLNTTGSYNFAGGTSALTQNTTGASNTALGTNSLYSNTTGSYNTAVGYQAAYNIANTGTPQNTALGYQAMYGASGAVGYYNTAIGGSSLYSISSGNFNTAVGIQSLYSNTTAANNTAVGYQAGYNTTTGFQNLFSGQQAGYGTTTGVQNTAIGAQALVTNTVANYNTAVGYQSLYSSNRTADTNGYNAALGMNSGYSLTTGQSNTFLGAYAGYNITTGSKNSILGQYNGNQGGLDIRTASNYIVLSDGDGNPRQIIDSSGNLGLGVTPSAWSAYKVMQLSGISGIYANGQNEFGSFQNAYYNSGWKYGASSIPASWNFQYNGTTVWNTAPSGTAGNAITFTQAMTLDASGNLGIGTSSPGQKLDVVGNIRMGNSTVQPTFYLNNTTSGSWKSEIQFQNSGTSKWSMGVDLTATGNNNFYWYDNVAGSERMRIDSSGNLLINGTSSLITSPSLNLFSGNQSQIAFRNTSATAGHYWQMGHNNDSFIVYNAANAGVYITYGGTSWTGTSDERLKTDLKPIESAIDKISTLRTVTGRFKTDDENVSRAFLIAQDVQKVLPEAVNVQNDELGTLGIAYTDTIPLLVAAIKELSAKVTALEAQLATLTGAK